MGRGGDDTDSLYRLIIRCDLTVGYSTRYLLAACCSSYMYLEYTYECIISYGTAVALSHVVASNAIDDASFVDA